MLLVAAVTPIPWLGCSTFHSSCLLRTLCSSPGCSLRIHPEGPAGQWHRELCPHRSSAGGGGVALNTSQEPLGAVRTQLPHSWWGGGKPTAALHLTNTPLLNRLAPGSASRAGDEATLLEREQDSCHGGCVSRETSYEQSSLIR